MIREAIQRIRKWFTGYAGGGLSPWWGTGSYAGRVVTPDLASQITAVFSCVKVIAETASILPLRVYHRDGAHSIPSPEHPLSFRLQHEPNSEMSAMDFRLAMNWNLLLYGNAYARIAREGRRVTALYPLPSILTKPRRDLDSERLYYEYYPQGKGAVRYEPRDILHLRAMSLDGICGISPVMQARNAVGLAMALEEYGSRFFANGAVPLLVLEYPGPLDSETRSNIERSWKENYGGVQKSHAVAILEEGLKINKIGADPQTSQSLETRKFQIEEIARVYRVPLHMIGNLDRATFSNIEHLSLEFVTYTLLPWLEIWEQAINRSLFEADEKGVAFVEHEVGGLLRGDVRSRFESYARGRQWGWLSVNDIRRLENQNPIEDGDQYLVPLNMVPVGTIPSDARPTAATPREAGLKLMTAIKAASHHLDQTRVNGSCEWEA